ncbi:hypothetical protein [Pseudomonas sp. NPDC096950]|uniref:hypothetical protein n=1 Tax=Pseudomonas sp. NPDC096950 TaxID=3364485 RepID=UPI00383B1E9D
MQFQITLAGKPIWVESENESQVLEVIKDTAATYGPLPGNEDGISVHAPASVIDYRLPMEAKGLTAELASISNVLLQDSECAYAIASGLPDATERLNKLLAASVAFSVAPLPEGEFLISVTEEHHELVQDWKQFLYNDSRWAFGSAEVAEWDEEEKEFHFHSYHGLSKPSVTSVIEYLAGL